MKILIGQHETESGWECSVDRCGERLFYSRSGSNARKLLDWL